MNTFIKKQPANTRFVSLILPAVFYSATSTMPNALNYDNKKWQECLCNVREELDFILNASKRNPKKLIDILLSFHPSPKPEWGVWSTLPPEGRLEILSAINASADTDLFKDWASQKTGLEILDVWLKESIDAHQIENAKLSINKTFLKQDVLYEDTLLLSLLQVCPFQKDSFPFKDRNLSILYHIVWYFSSMMLKHFQMLKRLPMTIEILKNYLFAKKVMQINGNSIAHHFSDSAKVLAGELVCGWRQMVRLQKTHIDMITKDLSTPPCIPQKPKMYLTLPVQVNKTEMKSNTKAATSINHLTSRSSSRRTDTSETPKSLVPSKFKPQTTLYPMATSSKSMQSFHKGKQSLTDVNAELIPSVSQKPGKKKMVKQARFASDSQLCNIIIFESLE
ncbi:hypothetical protein DFH28DRAFT_204399 [Melampsora americana]|nr:hypothetical protein DFH28DRAFT_204399 [Melampsora americana]